MRLTKFSHATVRLEKDGEYIVTDPGTLTPESADLLGSAIGVLVTHEHFDHFDADAIRNALAVNPKLRIYGPVGLAELSGGPSERFTVVTAGESFTVGPFAVETFGGTHAIVHPDMPPAANIGYLIDGRLFHPGDSYSLPDVPVETLLMPTSGPWTSVHQAIDYIRAVAPTRAFQIHELELSEAGQDFTLYFLGPDGVGGAPISKLPLGATVDV